MLGFLRSLLRSGVLTTRAVRPSPAASSTLVAAAARGPLPVEIVGGLAGVPADALAAAVARSLEAQMTGLKGVRYTADAASAGLPGVRVVLAFDPAPETPPQALAEGRPVGQSPVPGRTRTLAAFCDGPEVLAAAEGRCGVIASTEDAALDRLVRQLARTLFDDADRW